MKLVDGISISTSIIFSPNSLRIYFVPLLPGIAFLVVEIGGRIDSFMLFTIQLSFKFNPLKITVFISMPPVLLISVVVVCVALVLFFQYLCHHVRPYFLPLCLRQSH